MRHLLILGARGQLGRAIEERARDLGLPCDALGRGECDVTDSAAVRRAIRPGQFVVNCAAFTHVDNAEVDCDEAYRTNAVGAENVAGACASAGVPLLYPGTDYVFSGDIARPAREDDPALPVNVYGRSKLAGEVAVRCRLQSYIILRTSWIFSAGGRNFVTAILDLATRKSELHVVNDQIGSPTPASDLARIIIEIVSRTQQQGFSQWGTYHVSGAPNVSRFELARHILEGRGVSVLPIASAEYPVSARRPLNSALDCTRAIEVFGISQPDWRQALKQIVSASPAP